MDTPVLQFRSNAINELVGADTRELSARLQAHRLQLFPPEAKKTLRRFSTLEAAKLIGVNDGYLRRLSLEKKGQPSRSVQMAAARTPSATSSLYAYISTPAASPTANIFVFETARSICRSSLVVNLKAAAARPPRRLTSPNISCFAATGCLRLTSIPRRASPRCTACSQNSTSERMRPSMGRSATTTAATPQRHRSENLF